MSNDTRLAILETTILNINSALLDIKHDVKHLSDRIDHRFDDVQQRFIAIDNKFENKFDALNNRIWSNFLWLVGMMIGLAGLIAHTQHWI